MKCPVDGVALVMSERHGIEIDYCPQCRGVWLDRGELDKILERAVPPQEVPYQPAYEAPREAPRYNERPQADRGYEQDPRYDPRYGGKPHKKRRESFLDDLFDFG
jgi:uncharacterized protein